MYQRIVSQFIIIVISCALSFSVNASNNKIDPYDNVAIVTNSIAWPYNTSTYGNDSYQQGSVKAGNADSLLLDVVNKNRRLHFPKKFGFGIAHAAYQYEGNRSKPTSKNPDGIGWSMWDVFSAKGSWLNPKGTNIAEVRPTNLYTLPNGQHAIQGYYPAFYHQDMQLAKKLGVKYYRISISWPRLFPHRGMKEANPDAIKYYQKVLSELKKRGFIVLITLYHWDLPAWLYNYGDPSVAEADKTYGWLDNHDAKDNLTITEYQKYAEACFKYFGKYTPYFSTFNEPLTFTNSGLYQASHAPGKAGFKLLRQKNSIVYGKNASDTDKKLNYLHASNIIKAHFIAYKTFDKYRQTITQHNRGKTAMLGIVLNSDWAEPYRIIKSATGKLIYHPDDIKASKRNMDFMLGWWLAPVMFGHWPQSMLQSVGTRLPHFSDDKSCLTEEGKPIACQNKMRRLSAYIQEGGALDYVTLNHYTGYFVADINYAKKHISMTPVKNSIPPDQYGTTPDHLMPGWATDQHAFITQFRYQKFGNSGDFAAKDKSRVFVIGKAGAKPWLRHTYFVYTKLLQYINKYYLDDKHFTKQQKPFSKLGIYLTENGTSLLGESQKPTNTQLNDEDRIEFIKGNLAAVWESIQQGINVKLYTYWSIADNFEWGEGYDSRFGLVFIDYANNFKRKPKKSFFYYQQCIKNNRVMP